MENYKEQFIEFMVRSNVLTFGDFVTKSGRKTPYFINTGRYKTGGQIKKLGQFYAEAVCSSIGEEANVLFGPAYKGIPLVVATAIALTEKTGRTVSFCFNRKEAKDHGEGGNLIGHTPAANDRIVIIEDVTTAGTSIRETVPLLLGIAPVILAGLVVSVDRMEKGAGTKSALAELAQEFHFTTAAIVTLDEIVAHLFNRPVDGVVVLTEEIRQKIDAYRATYGAER